MAIELKGISKSFGQVQALKGVSAVFEENKIYGLLGRNGAGKSTLLNILRNHPAPGEYAGIGGLPLGKGFLPQL